MNKSHYGYIAIFFALLTVGLLLGYAFTKQRKVSPPNSIPYNQLSKLTATNCEAIPKFTSLDEGQTYLSKLYISFNENIHYDGKAGVYVSQSNKQLVFQPIDPTGILSTSDRRLKPFLTTQADALTCWLAIIYDTNNAGRVAYKMTDGEIKMIEVTGLPAVAQ